MTAGFTAHIVNIGDELLNGRVSDQNAPWLGDFLARRGQALESAEILPDSQERIAQHLRQMWESERQSPQLIVLSGGLGPTPDDRTKSAIAECFDTPLKANKDVEDLVRKQYAQKSLPWTPKTNSYHIFPAGLSPLPNPVGLAPGLLKCDREKNKVFLSLPGVPREFRAMLESALQLKEVLEVLGMEDFSELSHQTFCLRTRFKPEEKIFGEIGPNLWKELEKWGTVSSLPQTMGVDIYVNLNSPSEQTHRDIEEYLKGTALAPYIWQFGQLSLPELVIREAREKNVSLGIAESCTGGLVANWLTNVSGSSQVFQGSIVSYANQIKEQVLRVHGETLQTHGAVSEEVAQEMAEGGREVLQSDICASFTGIAGPSGGSEKKPVGSIAIGLATEGKETHSLWSEFRGTRDVLKERFALRGLHWILDSIREDF